MEIRDGHVHAIPPCRFTAAFCLQLSLIKCLERATTLPFIPFPYPIIMNGAIFVKAITPFLSLWTDRFCPMAVVTRPFPPHRRHSNWRGDQLTSARSNGTDGSCFTYLVCLPLESHARDPMKYNDGERDRHVT